MYERMGQVHLVELRIDESILWLEKACSVNPAYGSTRGARSDLSFDDRMRQRCDLPNGRCGPKVRAA
jgi:hypothetical protein